MQETLAAADRDIYNVKELGAGGALYKSCVQECMCRNFPAATVDKNPPTNTGDTGSIPSPGRSHRPQGNQAHAPQQLSQPSGAHGPP